ncbi:hypothetical protein [Cohnella sp. REN36]|uniref:hypothetical protein n=1 Tax=Cohnella sp. REN36 TaxID=2887347 RepID=UPI001D13D74F|nr:hypothetical protein [Cohnella sp. REN36]MCC3372933.1 hypothetical protein [Cohnella sp. REN36]
MQMWPSVRNSGRRGAAWGTMLILLGALLTGCQAGGGSGTTDTVVADVYAPTVGQDVYGARTPPEEGVRGLLR